MDLSGVFAGTFNALKRRFGLLILISLLPTLVTLAYAVIVVLLGVSLAVGVVADPRGSVPLIIAMIVVGIAGGVVVALSYLKAQGMSTLAAYEIAQGQRPDLNGLWHRSKGFLPRMAPVIAIAIGALLVVYAIIAALAISMVGALNGRSGGAAAGAAGLLFLLVIVLIPVAIFIQIKLLYTVPAIALEQVGGIDGMKRSWTITRGAFWRTFGYYLVASLAVGVIGSVASSLTQVPLMSPRFSQRFDSPADLGSNLSLLMPLYLIAITIQLLVQLLTQPFLFSYVTYMYIDQVRRTELPPAAAWGGYGQPGPQGGYYATPNQYYGQPGQPYPPQPGRPGQPYPPQPGQPYPPTQAPQSGQAYPPAQPPQPPQDGGWQPPTTPQPPQG